MNAKPNSEHVWILVPLLLGSISPSIKFFKSNEENDIVFSITQTLIPNGIGEIKKTLFDIYVIKKMIGKIE